MKLNKIALACGLTACISSLTQAQNIEGLVKTNDGKPVANAVVKVGTSKVTVTTDAKGKFLIADLPQGKVELHVKANNFSHNTQQLELKKSTTEIEIVLNRSALEIIDIYATPLHSSTIESAVPINVLSGDKLKLKHASTLGETLKNEMGVHSSYYGPVSSSPIIRGLDGPRVLITQNGLDVSDASRVGPDHIVSAETSTATQIEVLRGPATLFYGSGAIGGVVNVVDERVPTSSETKFDYMFLHNTVANENEGSFNVNTGSDKIAFHLDAFSRKSDDYSIPGYAVLEEDHDEYEEAHDEHEEHEEGSKGTLENSSSNASGFTVGSSYLLDNGFVGFSYGKLDREYGIPGHHHHEEEANDDHEEAAQVRGKLQQDRLQMLSNLDFAHSFINRLASKLAYTDYMHQEIEGGEVGTQFNNKMFEGRFDIYHQEVDGWKGAWTLHYKHSDIEAVGEEAFTPPSKTENFAVAWLEEKHFGNVLWQLGLRAEHVKLTADVVEDHHEDGHEDHDEHEEDHDGFKTQKFTPISTSIGAVWDYQQGYNLAFSASVSQRAPSSSELFSKGAHIGTNSYEIGGIYDIHQHDDHLDVELGDQNVDLETSYNIDLTWRKFEGDLGIVFNAFYNHVDNYYASYNTGFVFEDEHDHDEEHDHEEEEVYEEGLPIYKYSSDDARLYGVEAQVVYQVTDEFKTTIFTDYTHAKLINGGYLPRIPPLRIGTSFDYQANNYAANLTVNHYFTQDNIADSETETDGYTMVDANVNYYLDGIGNDFIIFAKVQNLLDEEARVHSSFLKNQTPLPGRGFSIGVRGSF